MINRIILAVILLALGWEIIQFPEIWTMIPHFIVCTTIIVLIVGIVKIARGG